MYTEAAMADRVIRGDVGEALFRILADRHLSLEQTRLVQWGYNPNGVIDPEVRGDDPALWSGPDFALVEADAPDDLAAAKPLVGISINTQAAPYSIHSTRGAGCRGCPDADPCAQLEIVRTWFNLVNVTNDYRRFFEEYGVDVLMVTLFLNWRDRAVKWLREHGLDEPLKTYIVAGPTAAEGDEDVEAARSYVEQGARGTARRLYALRWGWWSSLASGELETGERALYSTFGFAQTASRPPMKLCVPFDALHDEESAWQALREIDSGGPRSIEPPSLDWARKHETRLTELWPRLRLDDVMTLKPLNAD